MQHILSSLKRFFLSSYKKKNYYLKDYDRNFGLFNRNIPDNLKENFKNLASNISNSKPCWEQKKQQNIWMVSAETNNFMKIGGLGVVASDLPEAFNSLFKASKEKSMTVVTPLYLGKGGTKNCALKKIDGSYLYKGSETLSIELKRITSIKVPFVSGNNYRLKNFKAEIFYGLSGDVPHIFIKNERFFNICPHTSNPCCKQGAYIFNSSSIDKAERMAFFSKAVYELLKQISSARKPALKTPDIVIANDWHAASICGLVKYLAKGQYSKKSISKKTFEYFENLKLIYIIHNLMYQGKEGLIQSRLLNGLYEDFAYPLVENCKNAIEIKECANPFFSKYYFNHALVALNLSDIIITVSKHYSEEISSSENFGYHFTELLNFRKSKGNFLGIVNGYTKSILIPTRCLMTKINSTLPLDLTSYDENNILVKTENKIKFLNYLNSGCLGIKEVSLYSPETTKINKENISKDTLLITSIGRFVSQKGFDSILAKSLAELYKKLKQYPILIILGEGETKIKNDLRNMKSQITDEFPEAGQQIFLFEGFNPKFRDAITVCSDLFLIPSIFEPCGLTQMEAMAKGCVPITTSTGGLVDTINDNEDGFRTKLFFDEKGSIVYQNPDYNFKTIKIKNNPQSYEEALKRAIDLFYKDKKAFNKIAVSAMKKDFSWNCENGSLYKYINIFETGKIEKK